MSPPALPARLESVGQRLSRGESRRVASAGQRQACLGRLTLRGGIGAGVLAVVSGVIFEPAWAQGLLPNAMQTFTGVGGAPLAGGFVYTYAPGTTTPKTTFVDSGLTVPNTNPIILNSNGQATIWGSSGSYREVVTDAAGNTIWDQITFAGQSASVLGPTGPGSSTLAEFALWNNTTGTLLKDGRNATVFHHFDFPGAFGATPTDAVTFEFGAPWPVGGLIPAGVLQGVVSTMIVPVTYTQAPLPNTNFAGYCDNHNAGAPGSSCVPFFSIALAEGGVQSTAFGQNEILSNTDPAHALSGVQHGNDFGALEGNECNPNVWKKPGGGTPLGQVNCFVAIGGGEVVPQGGAIAFRTRPFSIFNAIPWDIAYSTDNGGAGTGLSLGSLLPNVSEVGPVNPVNSASQGINLNSYGGSVRHVATLQEDQSGALRMQAPTSVLFNIGGTDVLQATSASPAANATTLNLMANPGGGGPVFVGVGIGAVNSCGAGARCLTIPN